MNKSEKKSFLGVAFETLGLPVFWGAVLTMGFYMLINFKVIDSSLVNRYFTGHPIVYFESALFFIGISALVLKLISVVGQFGTLNEVQMAARPKAGQPLSDVDGMIDSLSDFPSYIRNSYLVQRMNTMLRFVQRNQSAAGMEAELKHESEMDSMRQNESYALGRIIVWAIPMLGFLGTVIGITLALGDLSPQALVATPEAAMEGLLAGLSIAFDTTALALTLSIILMFCQFITTRLESELLEAVDARVQNELSGRFQESAVLSKDPNVASVQEMSRTVLQSVDKLMKNQTAIWSDSVKANETRWSDVIKSAGSNIEAAMTSAFRQSLRDHTDEMDRAESNSVMRTERQWDHFQQTLTENAKVMQAQQAELVKQGDLMLQAINASGDVTKVQGALNENLKSLSLMGNFDETIMSLGAAINLLNARLGATARHTQSQGESQNETDSPRVRLFNSNQQRRAA